jgi:hypothetical protein
MIIQNINPTKPTVSINSSAIHPGSGSPQIASKSIKGSESYILSTNNISNVASIHLEDKQQNNQGVT